MSCFGGLMAILSCMSRAVNRWGGLLNGSRTCAASLTVASTHPAVVVGNSDEVIAARPSIGVNQELGHVQIAVDEKTENHYVLRAMYKYQFS